MATIAPPNSKTAYLNIPPPPLPEFYLPKTTPGSNDGSSSKSSTSADKGVTKTTVRVRSQSKQKTQTQTQAWLQEPATSNNNAALARLPADPDDSTDERMRVRYTVERTTAKPVVTFAPPPDTTDIPPLAVYHICRICLRTRSARYHRAHPIPIDGLPPPPGICRRCRVSTVEEVSKVATVVEESESNKMKLGIAAFIPAEDYISNKEMKSLRVKELLREVEGQRVRERLSSVSESTEKEKEIVFRHVKVRESTSDPPLPHIRTSVKSTAQDAIDAVSVHSRDFMMTAAVTRDDKSDAQISQKAQSVSARSRATTRRQESDAGFEEVGRGTITAKVALNTDKPVTEGMSAVSRAISTRSAPQPAEPTTIMTYARSTYPQPTPVVPPSKAVTQAPTVNVQSAGPERSESEIRRIAREEIIRYRQAERKLEAHFDPYAHGRMVPIDRRIEKQADVAEPMPWSRKSGAVVEEVVLSRKREAVKDTSRQPRMSSVREEAKQTSPPKTNKARSKQDQVPDLDIAVKGSTPARQSDARRKIDVRYVDREYVIERTKKADSRVSPGDLTSGSGWVSDRRNEPDQQAQPKQVNRADERSERTERRQWDVMTEISDKHTAPAYVPRSEKSEKQRCGDSTEPVKAPVEARRDRTVEVKRDETSRRTDERSGYSTREIWLPPTGDYEVVEITKSTKPTGETSRVGGSTSRPQTRPATPDEEAMPDRILEVRSNAESNGSRPARSVQQDEWSKPASTGWSKQDDGHDRDATSARSSRYETVSQVRYRKYEVRDQPLRGPPSLSERSGRTVQSVRTSDRCATTEQPDKSSGCENKAADSDRRAAPEEAQKSSDAARPRAFDLRMAAAAGSAGAALKLREREGGRDAREAGDAGSDDGSDKTRWPTAPASAAESRGGRSQAGTERSKASAAPVSERGSRLARSPEREYIYTERIVEPISSRWDREDHDQHYVETREVLWSSKGSKAGSGVGSKSGSNKGDNDRSQIQSQAASSAITSRPPGSSLRDYRAVYRRVQAADDSEHSSGRVRFASKVDVSPTPPNSEASSTQFRIIGARPGSKKKMRESGEDLITEYEERRGRSRARDRARNTKAEPEYFYKRREVERLGHDGARDSSVRSYRPPNDFVPLGRPFSESPSRELALEERDWHGSYRPEVPRQESMDVLAGSSRGEEECDTAAAAEAIPDEVSEGALEALSFVAGLDLGDIVV
ncbi:hypothetical protein LTR56_003340 [Elasticomyces elasticus]|nr:hypothetical protein LTR56_003340 [Elasticomyces elasticus]KAK3664242.1 hypothetical protein LTR22_004940 [Elasticomyces elasticus]KAK4931458.1 hypothetical protein LTR49_002159 [Elasticomyces elasticus]KAK5766023.1 hypothetical protein LTS12_003769 [Elasticomyces elasticus]